MIQWHSKIFKIFYCKTPLPLLHIDEWSGRPHGNPNTANVMNQGTYTLLINVTQIPSTNLIFKVTSLVSPLEMANAYVLILYNLMWGKSPSPTLYRTWFFQLLGYHTSSKNELFPCIFSQSHPENIWERFGWRVWSTFLNNSKILLIYIVFHKFRHFFSAA